MFHIFNWRSVSSPKKEYASLNDTITYSTISAANTCVPMVMHSSNVPVKLSGMVTVPSVPTTSE